MNVSLHTEAQNHQSLIDFQNLRCTGYRFMSFFSRNICRLSQVPAACFSEYLHQLPINSIGGLQ